MNRIDSNAVRPFTHRSWTLIRRLVRRLIEMRFCGWSANAVVTHVQGQKVVTQIHECGYTTPLHLSSGGKVIDLLVRVRDGSSRHCFNLAFAEKTNSPNEKRMHLGRIDDGRLAAATALTPCPVKLNFRLRQLDSDGGQVVNVMVLERCPLYSLRKEVEGEIWRVHQIYTDRLTPGVYRIEISNFLPITKNALKTFLLFEKDRLMS